MNLINLICIRHGESEANVDPKLYETIPDYLISLTSNGTNQALDLGIHLKDLYPITEHNHYLIHSPWKRAKETSQEIMKNFPVNNVFEDPLIHEISLSHSFEEMKTKEFYLKEKDDYGHFYYKDGTSESYNDVYQRARLFVQELRSNKYNINNNSNVFIVSHGLFLIMLKAVLNNLTIEEILNEKWLNNCCYFKSSLIVTT